MSKRSNGQLSPYPTPNCPHRAFGRAEDPVPALCVLSQVRSSFLVGAILAVGSACPASSGEKPSAAPDLGCVKDVDCKGERICEGGKCANPPAEAPPETGTVALPPTVQGAAWVRGGPNTGLPSAYAGPDTTPELRWEVELGSVVFATATIAKTGDREVAYVGTHAGRFVGAAVDNGELVLDLDLGARVWARAAQTPEGLLLVGGDDDQLRAIDPTKGEVVWTQKLGNCEGSSKPGPEGARCDVDGGPTVAADGSIYVGADGLYKLNAKGETQWQWPPDGDRRKHVFAAPLLGPDGSTYFGDQAGYVNAVDARGETRWRYHVQADVDGSGVLGPDGTFYVGADNGRIYAIRADGSLKWSFVAQRDIRSAMSLGTKGQLYATSFDKNLYALGIDGAVKWVLPTGAVVHASPVVDSQGRIYFGSQDDHLYAVSPKGKVLWRYELPGDIDASVAIAADSTLIVGCDDGFLRALFGAPK